MPMGLCACVYYRVHVEVKGQFANFKSFLPTCWFGDSNASGQTWQQAALLSERSCPGHILDFYAAFTYGSTRTCFVEGCQYT